MKSLCVARLRIDVCAQCLCTLLPHRPMPRLSTIKVSYNSADHIALITPKPFFCLLFIYYIHLFGDYTVIMQNILFNQPNARLSCRAKNVNYVSRRKAPAIDREKTSSFSYCKNTSLLYLFNSLVEYL